jgi:hypothetical protein
VTWNCSAGFVDISDSLNAVIHKKRHYIALSSHDDAKVYVMYGDGDGPQIEQWSVPPYSGLPWTKIQAVPVDSVH